MRKKNILSILLGAALALLLVGCGGGGGTGDTPSATATGATGQVALMLTDGPADDYDQILITIRQVQLLPTDGSDPVVVFNPDEPVVYDLLDLRPQDDEDGGALLAVGDVPAGSYSKIRLVVDSVVGVQGAVNIDFKLSSGKIDLNPQGSFEVEAGVTLAVTLDIDCDKSIHVSGNHKNFRPVVFVDIERAHPDFHCPRVVQGDIAALAYGEDGETVVGFDMTLNRGKVTIPVLLDEASVIIDDQGDVADAQMLAVGDAVSVRGRLAEGGLLASMVVVGDVVRFDGIVTQAVADDQFVVSGDSEQTIVLTSGTLILWGCDNVLDPDAIQPGMPVRIFGKEQDGRIVAVAVLLKPHIVAGSLTAMAAVDEGYLLTVAVPADEGTGTDDATTPEEPADTTTVFLPTGAPIWIKGDGLLSTDALMTLVACAPREVWIVMGDLTTDPPLAVKVTVVPESIETTVTEVDTVQRLLITEAGTIHVKLLTPVLDLTGDDDDAYHLPFTSLDGIAPGDLLRVYALSLCPEDEADYEATLVLIVPAETETE